MSSRQSLNVKAARSSERPYRSAPEKAPARDVNPAARIGVLGELLGFRLRQIHAHLSQASATALADHKLRPGEFSALCIIAATPGVSQIALAREISVDKAQIVTILDDLEERGWAVRKQSSTDRRRHCLYITPLGDKALSKIVGIVKANEEPAAAALSAANLAKFSAMLDQIYAACRQEK